MFCTSVFSLDTLTTLMFSGLDSSNAAKVVDILAGLAAGGVGVVLTIHQPRPDVFRLMHRVLLLSGRGQVGKPPSWIDLNVAFSNFAEII